MNDNYKDNDIYFHNNTLYCYVYYAGMTFCLLPL